MHVNPDQQPGGRSTVCTAVNVAVQLRERHTRANNNYHWDWCVVTSSLVQSAVFKTCLAVVRGKACMLAIPHALSYSWRTRALPLSQQQHPVLALAAWC